MTLPASGAISFSQINTELIRGASATLSLNDTSVRRLTQKLTPGSAVILPNDFWGKAANFVVELDSTTGAASGDTTVGYGNCQDNNGNLFVTGSTRNFGTTFREHFFLAKYDSNGVLLWQRGLFSAQNDYAVAVVANAAGDVYATGYTNANNSSFYDAFVVKYNSSGVLQWQRIYGTSARNVYGNSIAVDTSGNVYIAGQEFEPAPTNQLSALLFKVDSSGNLVWARRYGNFLGGLGDAFVGNMAIVNGNLYLSGYATSGTRLNFVAKSDLSGNFLWLRRLDYGDSSGYYVYDMAVDASENIFVMGSRDPGGSGYDVGTLVKLDSSGNVVWNKGFQQDFINTRGATVNFASNGNLVCTLNDEYNNGFVLQLNSSGSLVWQNYVYSAAGGVVFNRGVTNINNSPCLTGYYLGTPPGSGFILQAMLLVLPNNGTGAGVYGEIEYGSPAGINVYNFSVSSVAFTLTSLTAGTTFVASSLTAAVPTLVSTKYNI